MKSIREKLTYRLDPESDMCVEATKVGYARQKDSKQKGYKKSGSRVRQLWREVLGSRGERVTCHTMGRPWRISVGEPMSPDFVASDGTRVEVRTVSHPGKRLIIRHPELAPASPKYRGDWLFVKVDCLDFPDGSDFRKAGYVYEVKGWLHGSEITKERIEQWTENPHDKDPAVFVPNNQLHEFIEMLDDNDEAFIGFPCEASSFHVWLHHAGQPSPKNWKPRTESEEARRTYAKQCIDTIRRRLDDPASD